MRTPANLRVYQGKAIEFGLSHPQAGFFLNMGLGKTATMETIIMECRRFGVGPALVVGPIRVIETVWRQEAKLWSHLKDLTFSLVRGTEAERIEALKVEADVYLINPEHLVWLFSILGDGPYQFETLVIDESSMFKNVGSKRFKALRFKVKWFSRRYILTGTPTPNKLLELWPQVFLLDEGKRLGTSFTKYKQRFFAPVDRWGYVWEPVEGAKEKIYELIADLVLRTDANDYIDMPSQIYNRIELKLPPKARKIYREVEDQAFSTISEGSIITAANAAVALGKCRQIANGLVYINDGADVEFIHDEKLVATEEIIEETGSPVIVVYNFKHELAALKKKLKAYSPVVLSESKDASKTILAWNAGKIQVLLLHPASGGHGLNLQQGGFTMIWFGLTFSYEQYIQTIARILRQGQTQSVMLHILIMKDTVDELLEKVLAGKAAGQEDLFKYLKQYGDKRDLGLT